MADGIKIPKVTPIYVIPPIAPLYSIGDISAWNFGQKSENPPAAHPNKNLPAKNT